MRLDGNAGGSCGGRRGARRGGGGALAAAVGLALVGGMIALLHVPSAHAIGEVVTADSSGGPQQPKGFSVRKEDQKVAEAFEEWLNEL